MPEKTENERAVFSFAMLRRESGKILSRDANRLKLMEAIMICVTPVLIYMLIGTTFQTLILPCFDRYSDPVGYTVCMLAIRAVLLLFTLLFTFPLLTGLLYMARLMVKEEEVALPDVFHAFSDGKSYHLAVKISFPLLLRMWVFSEAETAVYALFRVLARGSMGVMFLSVPVMIAVGIVWAALCMRHFGHTERLMRGEHGKKRRYPHAASVGWWYWLGFFPWLVLSLLTVGILLLADVLPRMLTMYCYLGENLVDEVIRRKDNQNE